LASGGRKRTVQIWESTTELKHHATLPDHGKTVWAVAWSPDSTMIAASGENSAKLWNVADKKLVDDLKGHLAPIRSLAFTDGGKKLVSGSDDNTVRVWDFARKSSTTLSGPNGAVVGVAAAPDGKSIYAVSDEAGLSARVFVFGKE
jgi:WD40 repeat protein